MGPGERDELDAEGPELAPIAAERVRAIVAAAEATAAEIVADAKADAERIRAAARAESEQQVEAASREANGRIEQARGAVEGLVAQADRLRSQVGALGRDLAANVPGRGAGPGGEPDDAEPAAAAASVAEPDEPVRAEPAVPVEPARSDAAEEVGESPAPAADQGAIRLVAMNMALEGASRDEIAKQVEADFGPVAGVESVLDDVLRRATR